MSDRKVIKVTGHGVAADSKLDRAELILTDTSLRYHDITTRLDPRVTLANKQSFKVEDRDQSKLQVSLEGNFFVAEVKSGELILRKNIEQNLKIILQNQSITLNPDLYYGKRLYNVLEMDLPDLWVSGAHEPVFLGSASSLSYDSTELLFNGQRAVELERYPDDTLVHYEIKVTRHDGQATLPKVGYLSFAEIKSKKIKKFVLLPAVPTSAFNLSSIQFSYRVTTREGARIDTFEDDKKDFLRIRVMASNRRRVDMKAINKAHALDPLDIKLLLNGKDLFKYLSVPFPRFRVFYDSGSVVTYNSVHRLDLSSAVKKAERELLIDMTSLASVVYRDNQSFLRVKGLTYLETEPSTAVVNFSYAMFDARDQTLGEKTSIGRCHFRKVVGDLDSAYLFNLDTQGEPYFFEMDIKDPLKENASASCYRLDLSAPFTSVAADQVVVSEVDFYYNQKMTFALLAKGLDFPHADLDIAPTIPAAGLEGFLESHVLAYTAIPFSFERMAKDVSMSGNFPDPVRQYTSVHGYSKTGRKIFSTNWLERSNVQNQEAWWRGVDVLVLCLWMSKEALSEKPSPYSYSAEREFEGGMHDVPYSLTIEGKINTYVYSPCLKGQNDYELDPVFSNSLYVGQGRSTIQGRGSPNFVYLMWDSHTQFDFAAEADFQKGVAPSRFKLMGVEVENIVMQVPGPEHELWGSVILEWAVFVDPKKELAATQDMAVLGWLEESHAALKHGSLTLVNFLKEPIGEFLEFGIKDRFYTLEVSPGDGNIYWRRQVDLSREDMGEKTVLRRLGGHTHYILRNSILGKPNTPVYPSDDGQDILVARGEVAYLHGGKNETQLIGNLPENFFYLSQGGTDNVIANGYRNTIEVSTARGGNKVLFLSTKKEAINVISAPGVSFRTAQIKDDDLFFFLETETWLLTLCLKGIVAWGKSELGRVSLLLEEGHFSADRLIESLRFVQLGHQQEAYKFQSVLSEPALQQGLTQLADTVSQEEHSKTYLKDQINQYDVVRKE